MGGCCYQRTGERDTEEIKISDVQTVPRAWKRERTLENVSIKTIKAKVRKKMCSEYKRNKPLITWKKLT